MSLEKTQKLYRKAKNIIPGGTQLLSKRPEMFAPDVWPPYYSRAKGCEIWDLDGNHYYDMSICGIGACLLGYNDPDVTGAVKTAIDNGSMCTLNPPEEVCLAEKLCEIHPWAEQVRFARCGGEAMAVAVRIARAVTGRSKIAVCGYHGWHDWYLAANLGKDDSLKGLLLPGLQPDGVPKELRNTTFTFNGGNIDEFRNIIREHGDDLAAVVMEPCRNRFYSPEFMEEIRELTAKRRTILIFDEITIGWRLCFGGAHLKIGITPDIAVFAKALGNGHPISAVIGTASAMSGAQGSFISSTYWTERTGPAAALAVLEKMGRINVPDHVEKTGSYTKSLWKEYGKKYSLPVMVDDAFPALAHFTFDHEKSNILKTLFVQEMLNEGFLAGLAFYPTLAHGLDVLDKYGKALDSVFGKLASMLKTGNIEKYLKGASAHQGFKRLAS